MALPIQYSLRNVFVRWRSTLATVLGIAAVVCVWIFMQALATGLERAGGTTGDPRNLLVVRKGSDSESTSQIGLDDVRSIQYSEEIARDDAGRPLISPDALVTAYLPRSGDANGGANVIFRGVSPNGPSLRPQVKLVAGRWFVPGKREIAVSVRLARRFSGVNLGQEIKLGARTLTVVGQYDAGGSAFDSEAWMDADEARAIFNRPNYASVLIRPVDATAGARLKQRLESDHRLTMRVTTETDYYAQQTKTAGPIRFMGNTIATIMSIGAVLAAMNTMYASVGARTREIGTLRVLGFRRRSVVAAILLEGACLAFIGGLLGSAASLAVNGYKTGTLNFQTFSETVFELTVTPPIVAKGLVFAALVGLVGALLPALRASRMPVIEALKAV
jgi:putative ABC transport system permease protein